MTGANGMEYRRMGASGLKVSALGIGGWTTFGGSVTEERTAAEILRAAFDAGINVYDIADIYAKGESERLMGRVLKDLPRHRLVITSKLFWPMSEDPNDRGLSRKHVMESVEKSLKRIGTDYLDVYFCHRFDPETPVEETARGMDDLVHQGKILYWGTSEWTGDPMREVHGIADRRNLYAPAVEQPQLNLLARTKFESDVRPAALDLGMGLFVWSPLASGILTGKYDDGVPEGSRLGRLEWLREVVLTETNVERTRAFRKIADEAGCSRARLALAWCLRQEGVSTVLTGATSKEQLEENLQALAVPWSDDLAARIDACFPAAPAKTGAA